MFFYLFFTIGPGVNRHKIYLKHYVLDGASPSPTQNLNYPQFSDIPNHEGRGDEIYRQSADAMVDVHRADEAAASHSHPHS